MSKTVRAKFYVASYETGLHWRDKREVRTVVLRAVMDDTTENKAFFDATPNGEIKIGLLNEEAWIHFKLGASYYVDFMEAVASDE